MLKALQEMHAFVQSLLALRCRAAGIPHLSIGHIPESLHAVCHRLAALTPRSQRLLVDPERTWTDTTWGLELVDMANVERRWPEMRHDT